MIFPLRLKLALLMSALLLASIATVSWLLDQQYTAALETEERSEAYNFARRTQDEPLLWNTYTAPVRTLLVELAKWSGAPTTAKSPSIATAEPNTERSPSLAVGVSRARWVQFPLTRSKI